MTPSTYFDLFKVFLGAVASGELRPWSTLWPKLSAAAKRKFTPTVLLAVQVFWLHQFVTNTSSNCRLSAVICSYPKCSAAMEME